MSANESAQNNPSTSPQTPRVTFRAESTPNTSTSASINNTQASSSPEHRDIELSREEIFENNLNQLFTKSFLAVLTSKDAVLKEIRDCVMHNDEARCKEVSHYIHELDKRCCTRVHSYDASRKLGDDLLIPICMMALHA